MVGRGDEKEMSQRLSELGPKIVCITDGENGNWSYYNGKIFRMNAKKVNVKEATGAGDGFASGFVYGFMKFGNIEKAAKIGTFNAESVIQKKGAKIGLLTWKEIRNKI